MDYIQGKGASRVKVLEEFQKHNDEVFKLVPKEYSIGTHERYVTARSHVAEYIRYVYGKEDIEFRELNYEFVIGYEHYLKTVRVCSNNTAIKYIGLTKASVHDIKYLEDVKCQINDCVLIGDKGYLSSSVQLDLFESANIELSTLERKNQLDYKPQSFLYQKGRKRIETLFSQLCDQFMIRRNYAKSFDGYKTKILSKITTLTTVHYINKFLLKRSIDTLK